MSGAAHHLQCRRVCVSVSDKHRIVLPNLVRISFFFKCLMRIEEITRHTTAFRISKAHSFPIERNAIFEMAIPRIFPFVPCTFFPHSIHTRVIYIIITVFFLFFLTVVYSIQNNCALLVYVQTPTVYVIQNINLIAINENSLPKVQDKTNRRI